MKIEYDYFYNQTKHNLVQQYFSLRTKTFIDQWNLKNFSGEEDSFDKDSIIIIAHKNGKCLGGARLIIKEPNSDFMLPMETNEFRINKLFPELEMHNKRYAELSRVSVINDCRNGIYSAGICKKLIMSKALSLNIDYVFCVTTKSLARVANMSAKKIGIPFEIKPEIKVPDLPTYEGHKMFLSLMDLTKNNSTEYQKGKKVEDLICK